MERRGISKTEIARVLTAPEQVIPVRPFRMVYQTRFVRGEPPRTYLFAQSFC
ncbi:hypothetical protein [Rhodothermus marinus]|uniref:hypothetical protein n=1 Tax=Rhodothermus marinus TaxID=29549 RepID=UPI0009DB3ACC